ncbi:1-(5-phosphoribosyl)-5-[(5-phosphoribosylamino)methylideneamino]imidazole-4-carboxamide isomerase [Dethiosulfatarculus sandiegensis]|uniref:1-(5-phosphoribosyl)-5-[(5-phosphoribosylamino)methylideneamino] imidazole-4-carboxamide isomerase n=1 Tax=Dethiosulfatarculus sandiegensis TaxID=1429043 RepID=A0A0D2JUY7_9BACT|nr:1-(5-phosphoribosyl)-5-[(5-phosphoribosylamino)methylideneamino]imidazole-4-carboxamide isomerase [Dethiosulfatarculus sandiegensis]KIX13360.1 1-(5-phosphoribosyl)-5-[(5-phosphoribosylamino)methylideneamino] imidazole-4-carboxamide isomerase [Dethiosulfatarculus sandiegensis]
MEVIPAIDLKDGHCVRLRQGRMDDSTVFSSDPVSMALKWQETGAGRLHVVDLDGAVAGRPANSKVISNIAKALEIPVQLGGGVRDLNGLEKTLELGVDRVILGTLAVKDPEAALQAAQANPGKVVIGIDAKNGMVATHGWTEESKIHFMDLAAKFDQEFVAAIVFTDIARDGMHSGVNLDSTEELCRGIKAPVIASGGVHDLEDIRRLKPFEPLGLAGVITGRAIYEGTLDLGQALDLARS